jgi:hypothetical protein
MLAPTRPTLGVAPAAIAVGIPVAVRVVQALPAIYSAGVTVLAAAAAAIKFQEGLGRLPASLELVGELFKRLQVANSKPQPVVLLPEGVFTNWPGTGTWDPVGVNEWGWRIRDGLAWNDSCSPIRVMEDVGTRTAPGEVAWLKFGGSYPRCGGVAHRDATVWAGPIVGNEAQGRPVATYRLNGISVTAEIVPSVQPLSGPGTGVPLPAAPSRLPDGWALPNLAAAPATRPVAPITTAAAPGLPALPGDRKVIGPAAPGVNVPAAPALPQQNVGALPVPGSVGTDIAGIPIPARPAAVPTTPADVHFPGGVAIPSGGVRASLAGIAAEVGRIENKVGKLFEPPGGGGFDWAEKLRELWDIINSRYEAGYYDLWAPCDKGPTGEFLHEKFEWDAGFSEFGSLRVRLDAIAQMLQRQKDWKQPICEPEIPANNGRAINVQFRSTVASPNGEKPLRKVFGYRDPSGKELIEHRDHWVGFEFESGPWQVKSKGAVWGQVQVWATSEAEGRRVIEHAAAIAGVNLQGHEHRWIAREVMDPRYGARLRMSVRRDTQGAIWVTERTGPNGLPVVAVPLAPGPGVGP